MGFVATGHAQVIEARYYNVSASTTNTTLNMSLPAREIAFLNVGSADVYVNLSGTGVAATTGDRNLLLIANQPIIFKAEGGERSQILGFITASGTATVHVWMTR